MGSFSLAALTVDSRQSLCRLTGHDVTDEPWRSLAATELSVDDRRLAAFYTSKNVSASATAMNESTVWARVIYPLLMLAEVRDVRAWSQVPIMASVPSRDAAAALRRAAGARSVTQYGCYTVGDVWTFVRARVDLPVDDALPSVHPEWSREYAERHEAETILKVLRGIASGGA